MEFEARISKSELRAMIQQKLKTKNLTLTGMSDDIKITNEGIVVQCKEYHPPISNLSSFYDCQDK